jgi:DNA-binding PadR family transcriptional regulator
MKRSEFKPSPYFEIFDIFFRRMPTEFLLNLESPNYAYKVALRITRASVSSYPYQLVKKLEKIGLIRREIDPNNKRRKILYLTPLGREIVAEIKKILNAFDDLEEKILRK